jgi:hypothetical protein
MGFRCPKRLSGLGVRCRIKKSDGAYEKGGKSGYLRRRFLLEGPSEDWHESQVFPGADFLAEGSPGFGMEDFAKGRTAAFVKAIASL